ncbi:MAG: LamG domain-containing protein, partial [Planctomycetota bacterium]
MERAVVLAVFATLYLVPVGFASERGLVAYYTFEEGPGEDTPVRDWSGHGNDGKNLGARYVRMPGEGGYALAFDTAEAYVDCGNRPSLNLTGELSIELWFYPETTPKKGEAGLVGKSMGSFMLSYTGGCWFYVTTGSQRTDCSGRAPEGAWHHIVATFDGKRARSYSDGELQMEREAPSSMVARGDNLYLRYPVVWGGEVVPVFKCMMDDVRVYNRALGEGEVLRHYAEEGERRGKDLAWLKKPGVEAHFSPVAATLVAEVDFSRMKLLPKGAGLTLELRDAGGAVVARQEIDDLRTDGSADWSADAKDLPEGGYEVTAELHYEGTAVGEQSSAAVRISHERPAWAAAYDKVKVLNNLVAELLSIPTRQAEAVREYAFTNPRDGWIYVQSTAAVEGGAKVTLSVDAGEAMIVHTQKGASELEAMRHLPAGEHKVAVKCEGNSRLSSLVVRSIPELLHAGVGYEPSPLMGGGYGPYDWAFLGRTGMLDNTNVILERAPKAENAAGVEEWLRAGKRRLAYYNVYWLVPKGQAVTADIAFAKWTGSAGFQGDGYGGIVVDEFSGGYPAGEEATAMIEAVSRIGGDRRFAGRVFYPYCSGMYTGKTGKVF